MPRSKTPTTFPLRIDRAAPTPISDQVYEAIKRYVLVGTLAPGMALPSPRTLAQEAGCARNTVLAAYSRLSEEGYVQSRPGGGTYVHADLPDPKRASQRTRVASSSPGKPRRENPGAVARDLERWATPGAPFDAGFPDLRIFPFEQWARISASCWKHPMDAITQQSDGAGFPLLRAQLVEHIASTRALACTQDEILIAHGTQDAVRLIAETLLPPGSSVGLEDPGFPGLARAIAAAGMRPQAVPIGSEGLLVTALESLRPRPRLVQVAPSRQFPTTIHMSLPRRLELLDWAHANDAWILEDDYDSEFRYGGFPLPTLKQLERDRGLAQSRVLYTASFTRSVFPAIRLAFVIAAPELRSALADRRRSTTGELGVGLQPVLAEFMRSGALAAHLARSQKLLRHRRDALLRALRTHAADWFRPRLAPSGTYLLAEPTDALRVQLEAVDSPAWAETGLTLRSTRDYASRPLAGAAYLFGFAAWRPRELQASVRRLVSSLDHQRT
jgi:GntR family transcriptional regulator/MocR family aminotransferase